MAHECVHTGQYERLEGFAPVPRSIPQGVRRNRRSRRPMNRKWSMARKGSTAGTYHNLRSGAPAAIRFDFCQTILRTRFPSLHFLEKDRSRRPEHRSRTLLGHGIPFRHTKRDGDSFCGRRTAQCLFRWMLAPMWPWCSKNNVRCCHRERGNLTCAQ